MSTRTAVVSGAAAGLGAAYARRLAELGYDVGLCDIDPPADTIAAIQASGRRAVGIEADASSEHGVAEFAERVHAELGPVSVLVNNVGISPYTSFEDMTFDEWRRVISVNLDSLFLMTKAFAPGMKDAGWGRIVNVTSALAWDSQAADVTHYVTSKMGVLGFTRALATELGPHGITVNAICPGIVRTELLEQRLPAERWDAYMDRQAIKRITEPDDLLPALDMFVGDRSGQITGANVPVAGGRVWV